MVREFIQTPFKHKRTVDVDTIVIHHIGSSKGKVYSVKGAIRWFTSIEAHRNIRTGVIENKVSAHYIIPREPYEGADLIQLATEDDVTYHAGRSQWTYADGVTKRYLNKNSVGIELQGDGNLLPYTEFQYNTLIKLLVDIRSRYSVPIENIIGHEDIAPGRKVDPGKFFDWNRVQSALNNMSIDLTPADDLYHIKKASKPIEGSSETTTGDHDSNAALKSTSNDEATTFYMESGTDDNILKKIALFLMDSLSTLLNRLD